MLIRSPIKKIILPSIILFLSISSIGAFGEKLSKNMDSILEKELQNALKLMPVGKESDFGFNHRDEFKKAILAAPYELKILSKAFIQGDFQSLDGLQTETGVFRFPVSVDNKYRAILSLQKIKDSWKFVDFGATKLSKELYEFEKRHPNNDKKTLLRYLQKGSDFVYFGEVSSFQSSEIYPLESAKRFNRDIFSRFSSTLSFREIMDQF